MFGVVLPMPKLELALPPRRRRPGARGSALPDRRTTTPVTPRHVLIVEDEALIAMALEAMVHDLDHVVAGVASNGPDAVRMALQQQPDIVLMDVRLGPLGNEGIGAAQAIQAQTSTQLIFVTAYANDAMVTRLNAVVPEAPVLAKPIDEDDLAAAFEEVLSSP
jgi:CheY-like chemotaxis protein